MLNLTGGNQTNAFGFFKSQATASLNNASVAYNRLNEQNLLEKISPMTPLISISYDFGIINFMSSLVPIVIVDANPHFSQIVLKNQINGHVLRSSYLQKPNPISYTVFAGYEF